MNIYMSIIVVSLIVLFICLTLNFILNEDE